MRMGHDSVLGQIEVIEQHVSDHDREIKQLQTYITGNGDVKQGLLWLGTMQGQMILDLQRLVALAMKQVENHERESEGRYITHLREGHYARQTENAWIRLLFGIADHVLSAIAVGLLVLILLGIVSYLGGGRL